MALFIKQDFTPPMLSRKWIASKCRPNMLLHSRNHIITILSSGLLFQEDSAKVEQESPAAEELWALSGGGYSGWFTRGERILGVIGVAGAVVFWPPRVVGFQRNTLIHISAYASIPVTIRIAHRFIAKGSILKSLVDYMRDYLALARRTMACVKEYRLLHKGLGSIITMLESTSTLLWRQQTDLSVLMARSSSAILGNFVWLYEDVDWDAIWKLNEDSMTPNENDLVKVHHAFLVIQSTLLKHIAMAHFIQPIHIRNRFPNHNERLYWLHNTLLQHLKEVFKENYESLDRIYRLLRNFGTNDNNTFKRTGIKVNDTWLYSEVHSQIARANIELKVALNKCTNLDMFLDSCGLNKQAMDTNVLNKDIDDLIDDVTKCLNTIQNSQIKLKKLQYKLEGKTDKFNNSNIDSLEENQFKLLEVVDDKNIIEIGENEPIIKDEVFFCVKTEEDKKIETAEDITTGPGKKEKDATKIVLSELKRKLVKREDIMRERERIALKETMPELIGNLPEFPRQIMVEEEISKNGFILKIRKTKTTKLFSQYKIQHKDKKNGFINRSMKLQRRNFHEITEVLNYLTIKNKHNNKNNIITIEKSKDNFNIIIWHKNIDHQNKIDLDSSGMSEGLSDVETNATNKTINEVFNTFKSKTAINENEAKNFKFTKKDLELSPSSSDSDFESKKEKNELLADIRRFRVTRKKNFPSKSVAIVNNDFDEGLKPVEYSFGMGMAMASMLQVNNKLKLPSMGEEEIFIGDGEVSEDSGNDEDA